MRTKRKSRLLSLGLCLCMMFSIIPMSGMTYAAETSCPDHQEHTQECGYIEAVEGAPCKHIEAGEHDAECGYSEDTPEAACDLGCTDVDGDGQTVHAEGCAYAPAVPGTPCKHEQGEHDEACGYIEAAEGQHCSHTCELCNGSAEKTLANGTPITGDGYTFEPGTGKLTVTSNAGTINWDDDSNIAADQTERVNAIKSVEIKSGVTAIGDKAFYSCKSLTSVKLPDTLQTIGERAFSYCYNLVTVNLPNTLQTIGIYAFYYCKSLTPVDLPATLQTIGENAFYHCTNLTSVELPDTLQTIETSILSNCENLTSVDLPANLQIIGTNAFYYCNNLMSVDLPATLQTIGINAFYHCTKLTELTFASNTAPRILKNAFVGVSQSGTIHFPHGASASYTEDWKNNAGLTGWTLEEQAAPVITGDGYSFALDSGALTISSNAGTTNWRNNAGIKKNQVLSLILQDSVTEIGEYAFSGCINLTDTGLGSNTFVKSIGISSFAGCRSLQETGLGSNRTITTIGEYAFERAESLKSTGLESNSTVRSLGAGVFIYCSGLQSTGFEGNSTIKSIGTNAFNSCTGLQSTGLESNSTVLGIGMYAFANCDNLRSTGLEHNSTVLGIGEDAFYYCTNLEDTGLASNSSVLNIKDYAFGHCEKLKSFVIRGDSIPVFGKNVFSNVADDFAVYYPVIVTDGSIREVSNGKRMENSVTNGASVTIRSDDAPVGMEFQEWTVDRGNIVLTPANSETATFTMIEDAVKVTATYKELTYALNIQTEDGGTVTGTASGQYTAGTPITLKAIPNSNHKFAGWEATGITLTSEQKGDAELSFIMPAGAVTLTAHFTEIAESTVTLSIPFTVAVKQDGNVSVPKETFILAVSPILWDDMTEEEAAQLKAAFAAAITIEANSVETDGKGTYTGILKLTASEENLGRYLADGFMVTEVNGGAENWTYDDTAYQVIPQRDDDGSYTHFAYLNGENEAAAMTFTNTYTKNTVTPPVTYYTLTFETNGGSKIDGLKEAGGTTIDLGEYKPTREGYEFGGWYADKDLKNVVTSVTLDGDKIIYAKWTEKITYYTLTFETNGGSKIDGLKEAGGTAIDLGEYKPTREGYEFGGWYADKDLKNAVSSVTLDGDKIIYAKWTAKAENPENPTPKPENPTPQTGDTSNPLPFLLLALASLLGCIGLISYKKLGRKKTQG